MNTKAQREITHKLRVFGHAEKAKMLRLPADILAFQGIHFTGGKRIIKIRANKD